MQLLITGNWSVCGKLAYRLMTQKIFPGWRTSESKIKLSKNGMHLKVCCLPTLAYRDSTSKWFQLNFGWFNFAATDFYLLLWRAVSCWLFDSRKDNKT